MLLAGLRGVLHADRHHVGHRGIHASQVTCLRLPGLNCRTEAGAVSQAYAATYSCLLYGQETMPVTQGKLQEAAGGAGRDREEREGQHDLQAGHYTLLDPVPAWQWTMVMHQPVGPPRVSLHAGHMAACLSQMLGESQPETNTHSRLLLPPVHTATACRWRLCPPLEGLAPIRVGLPPARGCCCTASTM